MSVFLGGSAYNMVRELADGFIIVTERTFKQYKPQDLTDFQMEADKYLREIRAAHGAGGGPGGDPEAAAPPAAPPAGDHGRQRGALAQPLNPERGTLKR